MEPSDDPLQRTISLVMTRRVITIREDQKISEFVALITRNDISGVPVVNGKEELVGIVTEYDLISFVSERAGRTIRVPLEILYLDRKHRRSALTAFEEFEKVQVSKIMSTPVHMATPDATVREVLSLMVKHDVNRIPIVEGGRLAGIVTRGDMVRVLSPGGVRSPPGSAGT